MVKCVLTGAPCTGKTEFLQWLTGQFKGVHMIPEIGSLMKSMNVDYATEQERLDFEYKVYTLQTCMESWVDNSFANESLILFDRGTLDVFAYCDMTDLLEVDMKKEYERYDLVIQFRCPKEIWIYNQLMGGNKYRDENFAEVQMLDRKLYSLWNKHPGYYELGWHEDSCVKFSNAKRIIENFCDCKMEEENDIRRKHL